MELVERLPGDHSRGCDGRNYVCSCGYDDRVADEIERLRAALEWYGNTFCEGFCEGAPEFARFSEDQCSGCRAFQALGTDKEDRT